MTTAIFTRPARSKEVFGFSKSTLYRLAKLGHFDLIKHRNMTFVRTQDVINYLEGLGD